MESKRTKLMLGLFFLLCFVLSFMLVFTMRHAYKSVKIRDINYPNDDYFYKQMAQEDILAKGQYMYKLRCYVCHGDQLQGNYKRGKWISGIDESSPEKIYQILMDGIPQKKPAWKQRLQQKDLEAIVVYVAKLKKQINK